MKRFLLRGTTALVGALAVASGAFGAAPARAEVTGQLEGWHSPASDTLALVVRGTSTDARLVDATMTVDGAPANRATFCADTEPACADQRVPLPLDTTHYADGVRQVVITIRDADGNTFTIDTYVEVWNNRGPNCSPKCTAPLSIGSAGSPAQPPGGNAGGGVQGTTKSSCLSPRLSMSLAQRPLRISHGVPVLLKGKSYRFTGRLTCLVGNKRRSAAKGARIDVRNVLSGTTHRRPGTKVGNGGKITVLLKYTSSRTIEFRYTNADGKSSKVRIKVRIAQRKR
jgi:hypothetical protein